MPKKIIGKHNARLTYETALLETALLIRKPFSKAAQELVKTAYLIHGRRNAYFTSYNISEKRFKHTFNMYFKAITAMMVKEKTIKKIAGEGVAANVYMLTEKGKEQADKACAAYGIKLLHKP